MTTWDEIMPGDVVRTPAPPDGDGLEWFVLDRDLRGTFALIRSAGTPLVGTPPLNAPVTLVYRGQLGRTSDMLTNTLGGEVIEHG